MIKTSACNNARGWSNSYQIVLSIYKPYYVIHSVILKIVSKMQEKISKLMKNITFKEFYRIKSFFTNKPTNKPRPKWIRWNHLQLQNNAF